MFKKILNDVKVSRLLHFYKSISLWSHSEEEITRMNFQIIVQTDASMKFIPQEMQSR